MCLFCKADLDVGLGEERRLFEELAGHPQAAALQHAFFAERGGGFRPGAPAAEVARAGVVGSGTMGAGIAMAFVDKVRQLDEGRGGGWRRGGFGDLFLGGGGKGAWCLGLQDVRVKFTSCTQNLLKFTCPTIAEYHPEYHNFP